MRRVWTREVEGVLEMVGRLGLMEADLKLVTICTQLWL